MTTNKTKKDWLFYGRYGDLPWETDFFGSQDVTERNLMTETEALELGATMVRAFLSRDECDELGRKFSWKVEEV